MFEHYKFSKFSQFAEKTGLSHQTASNYLKGKQKPDAEKLGQIIESFNEIEPEWIVIGKGKILRVENSYNKPTSDLDFIIELKKRWPELSRLKAFRMVVDSYMVDSYIDDLKKDCDTLKNED